MKIGNRRINLSKYIAWKLIEPKVISQTDFNNLLNKLDKRKKTKTKTCLKEWVNEGTWIIETFGNYKKLFINLNNRFCIFSTNSLDDSKNSRSETQTGRRAMQLVKEKFMKANENITLKKAFGYSDKEIKICNPKQFYYSSIDLKLLEKNYKSFFDMSGVDFSSQYPFNMCGRLPDYNKSIRVQGTVKPNEKYPFAFYLKSGHSAEFGIYDTHEWKKSKFSRELYRKNKTIKKNGKTEVVIAEAQNWDIDEKDDITVLCPASKYNLTDIYTWAYNYRKENSDAKLIANASIGYMAKADYRDYKLAHLRIVCICRANEIMRKLCEEKIMKENVIMIQVDGVLYKGSKEFGVKEKSFGCLSQEFSGCYCSYRGVGQYIVFNKSGKLVKCKHQGFDSTIDGSDIDKPRIISDIMKWKRTERSELFYDEE